MNMRLNAIGGDIAHAWRALVRKPGFTAAAVLCVGLGVSSNVAVFTLVRSALLRPLPYREPHQLVAITLASAQQPYGVVLDPEMATWRQESRTLSGLAAWNDARFTMTGSGVEPEDVKAALVNGEFLDVLGVHPLLGRGFTVADDQARPPRSTPIAILGYKLWTRVFNADPRAIGRPVMLSDRPYEIVGVLPEGFRFPGSFQPDLLVPGGYSAPPFWSATTFGQLNVIGRLADGVTPQRAVAEIAAIQDRHAADVPAGFAMLAGRAPRIDALSDHLTGTNVRTSLLMLMGAVALVVLIAIVNMTGLQLARTLTRRGELSVRAALGASRSNLARLVLSESLVLSLAGTAIGIGGAYVLVGVARAWPAGLVAPGTTVRMDAGVILFAIALGLLIACLSGAINVIAASRFPLQYFAARPGVRGWTGTVRYALVAGQVAIAFVLLIGAGLLLRSFANVLLTDTGVRTEHVLTVQVRLPSSRYDEPRLRAFAREVIDRLHGVPGVQAAAVTNSLPFTSYSLGAFLKTDLATADTPPQGAPLIAVSPEYFTTFGVPIVAGRMPMPSENGALVSETFVKRFFAGITQKTSPIGRSIRWGQNTLPITGIVADVKHAGPEKQAEPEVFIPFDRHPGGRVDIAVRTSASSQAPLLLAQGVRNEIRAIDKALPIGEVTTLERRLADLTASRRFQLWMVAGFAAFGLLLATLGLYASIAYTVNESRADIALRMALGAEQSHVRNAYLRRGLRVCLIGLAIGAIASLWLVHYVESLLFEIRPMDPINGLAAAAIMLATGLLAAYLPARSAARTDPISVLRCE